MGAVLWSARRDPTHVVTHRVRVWLRALLRRERVEQEMNDEMRSHLERAVERLIARGMPESDARAEAKREFGNLAVIQEESRDARGVRWIEDAVQDVRFGMRSLLKTPAFTAVAVLSLVLGIGVNTAIFTMLKVALRPGTIVEPETFVYIPGRWSKPAFDHLRSSAPAFSTILARSQENVLLAPRSSNEDPQRASAELVTENFFAGLRAPIALGRGFGPDDVRAPGREPVAVLNHRFWKSRFNEDSSVIGRTMRLATGATYTVIGVASRDFTGIRRGGPDFWVPYTMRPTLAAVYQLDPGNASWLGDPTVGWLELYGRLAPGHTLDEARAQIDLTLRQLARADSAFAPGLPRDPIRLLTAEGGGINGASERLAAFAVLGATLIVLLVACFNVASLMLARATDRRREIAVRLSLGASRGRIVRQLIAESALVAVAGAVAAVGISSWTLRVVALSGGLATIANDDPERLARILAPDHWVLGFALGLSVVSAMICGLAPSLRATRFDLTHAMKAGAPGAGERSRLRGALVTAQVALSLVLLVSAGVLLRSFARALALDTGFNRERIVTVETALRQAGYDSGRAATFTRVLAEGLLSLPGVRVVARGDIPLMQRMRVTLTTPATSSSPAVAREGYFNRVSTTYFAAFGIPIVRGRGFTIEEADARSPVVIVSEATARTIWGADDPLGKTLKVTPVGKAAVMFRSSLFESAKVVGVARDAQLVELGHIPPVYAYVPANDGSLIVAAAGSPHGLMPAVRDLGRSMDANALVTPALLENRLATQTSISATKVAAAFAAGIGALALTLAAVGIFGLIAYAVAQRTRELGIRRALGAQGGDVVRLVLHDGLRVVGIGVVVGVLLGALSTRLLSALLYGMSPLDPIAYAAVGAMMGLASAIAAFIPARRAMKVDPLIALKAE